MMYDYHCIKCGSDVEIIKSMHDAGRSEPCPVCELQMERIWNVPLLSGTSVENAEFNPGLGTVVKNKKHREELAKRNGLIEIGNDYKSAESMDRSFEKQREEKRRKSWDEE